ncbi:hypothetical protein 28 [Diadegma semiclausum ichnovirus]|nr:hypothetical protein 28 [Diadegma semiclausum ichnovirus]
MSRAAEKVNRVLDHFSGLQNSIAMNIHVIHRVAWENHGITWYRLILNAISTWILRTTARRARVLGASEGVIATLSLDARCNAKKHSAAAPHA